MGSRWLNSGLGTAINDVRYALRPQIEEEKEGEVGEIAQGSPRKAALVHKGHHPQHGFADEEGDYEYTYISAEQLRRILCPITGSPMRDPVTAADGHAYERYVCTLCT